MVTDFRHDDAGTPAASWRSRADWADAEAVDLQGLERLVVVAAHPDDETLGAGGLIATAVASGIEVQTVILTAGEHSHPDSPTHTPEQLGWRRQQEASRALATLGSGIDPLWLSREDGDVEADVEGVTRALVGVLGDASTTLVVAPWRHDGHPDHEAAGEAASAAAYRCGARLLEYPVWWWHWGDPGGAWPRLARVRLSADAAARKSNAIATHATQVRPLSDHPGDEVLLGPEMLEHFEGRDETFVRQAPADLALERLHAADPDPWGVDRRWFEQRKRAMTLAALPRRRFQRALELGCSVGALSEDLSTRCEHLTAVDSSPSALQEARQRTATTNVEVRQADLVTHPPEAWVTGTFDLIVISEVGYFLSPAALRGLVHWTRSALTEDGVLVLCHWIHPVEGWALDGPAVHAAFRHAPVRPVQCVLRERDFELVVLSGDADWPEATS